MTNTFSQSFAYGTEGEHIVGQLLTNSGFTVLPLYQFADHIGAPKVYSTNSETACPDLIAFKNSGSFYVEVKRKQRWVNWNGELETGFNQAHWEQYKQLQNSTGIPVFLVFVHEKQEPHGIFITRLDSCTRSWDGCKPNGQRVGNPEMFYSFDKLYKLNSKETTTL